jgi:hypothetical protein
MTARLSQDTKKYMLDYPRLSICSVTSSFFEIVVASYLFYVKMEQIPHYLHYFTSGLGKRY